MRQLSRLPLSTSLNPHNNPMRFRTSLFYRWENWGSNDMPNSSSMHWSKIPTQHLIPYSMLSGGLPDARHPTAVRFWTMELLLLIVTEHSWWLLRGEDPVGWMGREDLLGWISSVHKGRRQGRAGPPGMLPGNRLTYKCAHLHFHVLPNPQHSRWGQKNHWQGLP